MSWVLVVAASCRGRRRSEKSWPASASRCLHDTSSAEAPGYAPSRVRAWNRTPPVATGTNVFKAFHSLRQDERMFFGDMRPVARHVLPEGGSCRGAVSVAGDAILRWFSPHVGWPGTLANAPSAALNLF